MQRFSSTRRQTLRILGVMALSPAAMAAPAAFPSKPIRIVVPFAAGSGTDFIARLTAERLTEELKQPVVVENKPGAGGVIGSLQIARSAPDGYTIGIASLATLAMLPATMTEAPYDATRDFAPLTELVTTDLVLATSARVPASTLAEFVAWGRSQKDSVFLATFGPGTSGHFAGFLFGNAANIKFESVHFKTVSDAITALVSGDVHLTFAAPSAILPLVKAGKLRALATNGATRMSSYPEAPTFREAGYPNMQFRNWIGLVAPANTPPDVLDKLNAAIVKITVSPVVRGKLEDAGYRVIANTREEFASDIRKDVALWRDMVKATNFKI